ncbi:hypothetical protein GIB67_022064 [Kingdonia uniflora]|uniref:Uncharacterized protein n=1 Tax=Kingdonia uniflora TaxID=39325 RepID=A0A7J7MUH5_9MAGN|nr:hypothetical protein GIB67_022064 [Kingdonia uniflora]
MYGKKILSFEEVTSTLLSEERKLKGSESFGENSAMVLRATVGAKGDVNLESKFAASSESLRRDAFGRYYSHYFLNPFKDLRFMEQAQYEIDTYGTKIGNILKLNSLMNIREKCIQEFQRDVAHKYFRNIWEYLKNKYKIWETLKQLAGEGYDEVTGTFNLTEHR